MHESGLAVALDAAMRRKYLLHEMASVEVATARASRDPAAAAALARMARAQIRLADAAASGVVEAKVLDSLERQARDAERAARLVSPVLDALDRRLAFGVTEIAAQLAPDEALVEFVRYRPAAASFEQYGAFILRPSRSAPDGYAVRYVDLGPAESVEAVVRTFRSRMDLRDHDVREEVLRPRAQGLSRRTAQTLDQLRRTIWDPLVPHIEGVSRLYVAMDGELHGVPLEACVRIDDKQVARYLIEWPNTPEIAYLGSGRELLREANRWPHRTAGILAFVDPDFDSLPAAEVLAGEDLAFREPLSTVTVRPHESVFGIATLSGSVGESTLLPIFHTPDLRRIGDEFIAHLRLLARKSEKDDRPHHGVLQLSSANEQAWRSLFPERTSAVGDMVG